MENNPWLQDNHKPVTTEMRTEDLEVLEGTIPSDLDGIFIRNGGNPQFTPFEHYHWIDGCGMLHAIDFSNGKATYTNRFVRTRTWEHENKKGKAIYKPLGTVGKSKNKTLAIADFMWNMALGAIGFVNVYDKHHANTSIVHHNKHTFALAEGHRPYWVLPTTLETVGEYTFNGQLNHKMTAHPKVDPVNGDLVFFAYDVTTGPPLRYRVADKDGNLSPDLIIPLERKQIMHDFVITDKYSLFFDCPFGFNKSAPGVTFDSKARTRVGVLPRYAKSIDELKWFEIKNCWVSHTGNAWEEDGTIVIVGMRTQQPYDSDENSNEELASSQLNMWRLDIENGTVEEKILFSDVTEFPIINNAKLGRKSRYIYAGCGPFKLAEFDTVYKMDLSTPDSLKKYHHGKNRYGGEFMFVQKPNATGEDDGYLIGFLHDENTNKSEAVILNANDMTLVCRIAIPQRVPYGFHAGWFTREQVDEELQEYQAIKK